MQQHPSVKIFIASAVGAFIGTLVGLQFTPMLWWIGLIVGGFVGYLSYEFNTIIRAIPVAAKQARYLANRTITADYRPMGKSLASLGVAIVQTTLVIVCGVAFCLTAGLMWTLPVTGLIAMDHPINLLANLKGNLIGASLLGFLIWMATMASLDTFGMSNISDRALFTIVYFKATPFGILFYWLPRGIWALIRGLVVAIQLLIKGIVFAAFLVTKIFTLVHTDRRLLCGIDAAIGAGLGIFAHNPFIGALAGGIVGLVDYELVSRRLLKVESKQS